MKGSDKAGTRNSERRAQKIGNHSLSRTFSEELINLRERSLLRKLYCIDSYHGQKISIRGTSYLNFSSNDYLDLSRHPAVIHAAASAVNKYGIGSGASRLLSGTSAHHKKLEDRIARFKRTQAAIVFNTGYAANTGIIPAIAGRGDVIFSDELNHASIVDGVRLSGALIKIYRHKDMNHLEALLKKYLKGKSRRGLVVTDSVFSMDGDIAPLKDMAWLCDGYDALLMIDDAHGTGVLGKTGRGGLEHAGIKSDNIIQMGTLGKAAGCFGAFVAGKKDLIELLMNRARSFIYSTSLPPAVAAAGVKAIDIIDKRSKRLRGRLWRNRERLCDGLEKIGFDTLGSETPVIPVLTGDVKSTLHAGRLLYKDKIFAPAIRPPTVPQDKCRIRFSVTAGHSDEDIDRVLECLDKFR